MVPGRSMILPGTIPETTISCEWSWQLKRPPDHVLYGSRLYGGFVNSAVTALFTKLPAERFPALPGIIPENP